MYREPDLGKGVIGLFFIVVGLVLLIAFCSWSYPEESQGATVQEVESDYALDLNNAAQMHKKGLPTKADIMEYHMRGWWGYSYVDDSG